MDEKIKNIIDRMNFKLAQLITENKTTAEYIERRIISPILLEGLGHNVDNSEFITINDDYSKDFYVFGPKGQKLYVRCVKYGTIDSQSKLIFIKETLGEAKWKLLTDGNEIILINDDIKSSAESGIPEFYLDKIVFHIRIRQKDYWKFLLKYISDENLFESENASYFKDIAQFKAKRTLKDEYSFNTYKSTLFSFFDFYADNHPYSDLRFRKYQALAKITIEDFKQFIIQKQEKKGGPLAKDTLSNNYSHISSMLRTLDVTNVDFKEDKDLKLSDFEVNVSLKDSISFNQSNIQEALAFFYHFKQNNLRNISIFFLSVFTGLDRSDILKLKWDHIKFQQKRIRIDKANIPVPERFISLMKLLKKESDSNDISIPNVFTAYHHGTYQPISISSINKIFSSLGEYNGKFSNYSSQYIRKSLANLLFQSGFSLEDIAYLMNIELRTFSKYFSPKILRELGEKRLKEKITMHPFYDILDQCDFDLKTTTK